jgi:endonuclease/exonuclease/phosphatase family metal-dependent hydrolase
MRPRRFPLQLALASVLLAACSETPVAPPRDATVAPDRAPDAAPDADAPPPPDAAPDASPDVAPDAADDALDADDVAPDLPDDAADAAPTGRVPCAPDAGMPAGLHLRIAAANLTSGNLQTYEAPGVRIFQALRPDVVMIQEFRYGAGTQRALVDAAFGTTFQFVVEEPSTTGIPNGIISRYPILESGEWDDPRATDRDFVWAHIDLPGPVDLWAFSVHLLRSSPDVRASQASDLLARIAARVTPGDHVVVGGDLNANMESEPVLATFGASLRVGPPYPLDQLGNNRTSGNRSRPYDWVLARESLAAREVPVQVGAWCYPSGLVFDSRVFTPLADVSPVLPEDSAAVNMQHMLVVRDYVLPTP